jgi:hypothetical protein
LGVCATVKGEAVATRMKCVGGEGRKTKMKRKDADTHGRRL